MAEYIERSLALERINSLSQDVDFDSKDEEKGWNNATDAAFSEVGVIPIADVRPERHGHWGSEKIGYSGIMFRRCSCCGHCGVDDEYANYCARCGAKMDG